MKEKRQRRVTFFLPAIILMLIYFFSFIPVNVNCLSRTHTYTQPSLTTRRQTGPYGALLFLFFLLELSYGFLSLSIYIHSQLFFFCPILFFFCLLGSFGPETKNQPSRVFDDKQVKERASVSHIIYACHPLEVSSASEKKKLKDQKNANALFS
jgi:hypothetical protein